MKGMFVLKPFSPMFGSFMVDIRMAKVGLVTKLCKCMNSQSTSDNSDILHILIILTGRGQQVRLDIA